MTTQVLQVEFPCPQPALHKCSDDLTNGICQKDQQKHSQNKTTLLNGMGKCNYTSSNYDTIPEIRVRRYSDHLLLCILYCAQRQHNWFDTYAVEQIQRGPWNAGSRFIGPWRNCVVPWVGGHETPSRCGENSENRIGCVSYVKKWSLFFSSTMIHQKTLASRHTKQPRRKQNARSRKSRWKELASETWCQ